MPEPPKRPRLHLAAIALCLAFVLGGGALLVSSYRIDRRWIEIHMTKNSCAEHAPELARGKLLRLAGIVVGALLLLTSPLALRWARTPREVAGATFRIVAAAGFALVVCDLWLRWKGKPPPPPIPLLHYEPDSEGDARFKYRPIRSHVSESHVGDKLLRFTIDANGYRVLSPSVVVDFSKPTILATGESVASGFGLNYEETYPYMIEQELGVQTVNLAVQGSSSDWAYVRLSEELQKFQHPVATVTLLHHMLVDREMWTDRPHFLVGEDGTKTYLPEPAPDDSWLSRSPLLRLYSNLYHSDEGLRRVRAIIKATAKDSIAKGAFPLFVLTNCGTPCLPDETGISSIDHTLFDGLDVVHVRVDVPDSLFDFSIGHANRFGQAMIAEAIERVLRERGVLTASR
jgi:hypothetical protein